jgi:hypothetical protein
MSYVYLLNDTESYKIGVAKNVEQRIKTLQTGNKVRIDLIYKFKTDTPFKLEKILHRQYSQYKSDRLGEWFDLPDSEVSNFIHTCKKHQDTINFLLKNNPFYK